MKKEKKLLIVSDEKFCEGEIEVIIPWDNLPKQVLESLPEHYFHNRLGIKENGELDETTVIFATWRDDYGELGMNVFRDTKNNILFLW